MTITNDDTNNANAGNNANNSGDAHNTPAGKPDGDAQKDAQGKRQGKAQANAQASAQANAQPKTQSHSKSKAGNKAEDKAERTSSGKASRFFSDLIDRILGKDLSPWLDLIQTDLRQACGLLTRLPLPESATAQMKSGDAPRFYWAFPLVGVIIAGLSAAPLLLLLFLPIPPFLLAVFILLLAALLTGALHEDGLADLADSLGGQSPKARLAIMRDSSIGTFGVLALVIIVVIHVGALTVMIGNTMLGGWVAAAAISRAMMVLQAWMHPPARSSDSDEAGLAAMLGQPSQSVMLICLGLAVVVSFIFAGGLATFLAMLAGLVVSFIMGVFTRAHLGGVTGDALGATQQITSAVAMIIMVASA